MLKPESLGRAFGVTLDPDSENGAGWMVYHSPDIGHGWTYWVQQSDARPSMKNGFRFWFDHPDRTADATPVCALPLDRLRSTLTQHGWVERPVPSEIGSILAVEFSRNDVVLTLTPRDGADIDAMRKNVDRPRTKVFDVSREANLSQDRCLSGKAYMTRGRPQFAKPCRGDFAPASCAYALARLEETTSSVSSKGPTSRSSSA